MDEISRQLKEEIESLQEYIQRFETRFLANKWTAEMLDPFEQTQSGFEPGELKKVLIALYHAKHRFSVNGPLSTRIEAILQQYPELLAEALAEFSTQPEEDPNKATPSEVPFESISFGRASPDAAPLHDEGEPSLDELFESPQAAPSLDEGKASARLTPEPRVAPQPRPSVPVQDHPAKSTTVDVFSEKVVLDDLLACLDISLPKGDVTQLEQKLQHKLQSGIVPALENHRAAEKQFVLMPRFSRFVHHGTSYPCTVQNLVQVFSHLFGKNKNLLRYREYPFATSATPEPGWFLITPEAPRETLGLSYMEQNQSLRIMGPTVGLPSHTVRRRTMAEAVFDLIVGGSLLNAPLQRHTLDWTSDGPTKKSFTCVFYSEQGIRIRDLLRTTRHRALGFCPNW